MLSVKSLRSIATFGAAVALVCFALPASAATIINWAPDGNNTGDITVTGTSKSGRSLSQDTSVSVVRFSRVGATDFIGSNGIDGNTDQDDYQEGTLGGTTPYGSGNAVADGWATNDINAAGFDATTKADALANGDFLSLVLSTTEAWTITDLSFELWRNGAGAPDQYAIYYRVAADATGSDASATGFIQAGTDFAVTGSGYNNATQSPTQLVTLTASGLNIDFGSLPANSQIQLRLYGFGVGNGLGGTHITGGTVLGVVPEPATVALLSLASLTLLAQRRRQ